MNGRWAISLNLVHPVRVHTPLHLIKFLEVPLLPKMSILGLSLFSVPLLSKPQAPLSWSGQFSVLSDGTPVDNQTYI